MNEGILVPLFLFATMAITFWGGFKFSAQKREAALNTVRAVVEKTGEVSPELMNAIGSAAPRKNADLRKGLILIAVAAAFAGLGYVLPGDAQEHASGPMLGIALFPGLVGLVYVAFHFMGGDDDAT